MPFNVHTTDKVTMITVSGFITILFEAGLTVIQIINQREFYFEVLNQSKL